MRRRRWPFFGVLALLASGLGCGGTSLFGPTPTPTVTPTATELPSARYARWPVVVRDFFSEPANDWSVGEFSDRFSDGTLSITGGKYRWEVVANDGFIWWTRALETTGAGDNYVSVSARRVAAPADADWGLVVRLSAGNFYYFYLEADGTCAFSRYYLEKWETVTTCAAGVEADAANTLAVGMEGDRFQLFVNDLLVGEAVDDRIAFGGVGVAVEMYTAGDEGTFEFDNFIWRAPRAAVATVTPTPAP